jgi:hypothetical protein
VITTNYFVIKNNQITQLIIILNKIVAKALNRFYNDLITSRGG